MMWPPRAPGPTGDDRSSDRSSDRFGDRIHQVTDRVHDVTARVERRHGPTTQLAMGIFLMALGVVLTLDRLQLIDASHTLRLWPVGLIVLGGTILARQPGAHGRFWGGGWIVLGAWLLLNTLGLVRVGFWDLLWPLLLMFFGVKMILRTTGRGATAGPHGTSGIPNLIGVLSESKRSIVNESFRGAHMTSILGGCVLDLRQAALAPGDEAVIDVLAFMGGQEIVVPSGWTVVPEVVPVLGAVDDKRLPAIPDAATGGSMAPRLVLRGVVILGGLTIKT